MRGSRVEAHERRAEVGPNAVGPKPSDEENLTMHLIGSLIDSATVLPILIFGIPIIAIVGGITSAIVKTVTDARIVENAQRERIAAIQAGIDPSRLPPVPALGGGVPTAMAVDPEALGRHRAQGLLIGGIITLLGGVGLLCFFYFFFGEDGNLWAIAILPMFIGVALLISALIVKPRKLS
jgi:hypothetical protein